MDQAWYSWIDLTVSSFSLSERIARTATTKPIASNHNIPQSRLGLASGSDGN